MLFIDHFHSLSFVFPYKYKNIIVVNHRLINELTNKRIDITQRTTELKYEHKVQVGDDFQIRIDSITTKFKSMIIIKSCW